MFANVVPMWQMEQPLIAMGEIILSSKVLNRASSQMCGRWYCAMVMLVTIKNIHSGGWPKNNNTDRGVATATTTTTTK